MGNDEPSLLETHQCGVHGTDGETTARGPIDLISNRRAKCVRSQTPCREHGVLFDIRESLFHFPCTFFGCANKINVIIFVKQK